MVGLTDQTYLFTIYPKNLYKSTNIKITPSITNTITQPAHFNNNWPLHHKRATYSKTTFETWVASRQNMSCGFVGQK